MCVFSGQNLRCTEIRINLEERCNFFYSPNIIIVSAIFSQWQLRKLNWNDWVVSFSSYKYAMIISWKKEENRRTPRLSNQSSQDDLEILYICNSVSLDARVIFNRSSFLFVSTLSENTVPQWNFCHSRNTKRETRGRVTVSRNAQSLINC